ncbi:MAG: ORF6N domain-containing protein, partial [Patescibacteria group bacterium]|nr:ORF6N domain-containing protein [Patescibacteria group bacterium]
MSITIPVETIERRILLVRGVKVMLDADIANLYGVSTMQLNQAVKRNLRRFPSDFMFRLTKQEKQEVITICDNLNKLKFSPHLPFVFTEHGVAMLSAVLKSPRAVTVSVFIVRAFMKLREILSTHKELAAKMQILENEQEKQGKQLAQVLQIIKHLL